MAYIVELTYEDNKVEVVPLWSTAFLEEIYSIQDNNPDLMYYKIIVKDPSEDLCKHFDTLVERTKYVLPKQYKPNRKRL